MGRDIKKTKKFVIKAHFKIERGKRIYYIIYEMKMIL